MSPAQLKSRFALTFSALVSIVLLAACQSIVGGGAQETSVPTLSPTASFSLTPTFRTTFTELPGDMYFLYQTLTAAPSAYSPIRWVTTAPATATPQYTLTAIELAPTAGACVLAYPDFCVSPNIRLGCTALRDTGKHDFTVLPPDPYGYDKDGDGIGCEADE